MAAIAIVNREDTILKITLWKHKLLFYNLPKNESIDVCFRENSRF